jgi:hypothetical protein
VYGPLWLAFLDLRQAGLRSGLTALAVAFAILTISIMAWQAELQQSEMLRDYENAGAATIVAELAGVDKDESEQLVLAILQIDGITGAEAPYRGNDMGVIADISFLVFENEKQQEYLGGTTTVIGVASTFDLARDYYDIMGAPNADQRQRPLGIPLLVANGIGRAPREGEVSIPAVIADYVGVRPGVRASVELIEIGGSGPPIVRRYDDLRVIGTFDAVGPDEGNFAPFWRFAAHGRDVLTVRRSGHRQDTTTTLPVVVDAALLRNFMTYAGRERKARDGERAPASDHRQIVIRADTLGKVASVEEAVQQLLAQRGLLDDCRAIQLRSFCLQLPERNNFKTALHERTTFSTGTSFFMGLLLVLAGVTSAGLQLQTVIARWHEQAILEALGFTPYGLMLYFILRLSIIWGVGVTVAGLVSSALPPTVGASPASFATAAGFLIAVCFITTVPVLLWPLRHSPGERIRDLR